MEEIWAPVTIQEFSKTYEVSSLGNVRRVGGKILVPMRTGTKRKGAQRSKVRLRSSPRTDFDVAYLVLCAFVSDRPEGKIVMHKDDDSSNNSVDNIRWGTRSENARDSVEKSRHGFQKLGREQAALIKKRRADGERGVDLANEYGVSQQVVCNIFKGRSIFTENAQEGI